MLFVANLSFSLEDDGLAKLFADPGIKVVSARVVRRRWGNPRKSKGCGFVDVGNERSNRRQLRPSSARTWRAGDRLLSRWLSTQLNTMNTMNMVMRRKVV